MKCKKCKKEIENLKICPYCKAKNIKDSVVKNTTKAIDEVDRGIKDISFLNNPYLINNILIITLLIYMLLSIAYNYVSSLGLLDLIGNSFFYIFLTIYFILLKTKFGKERFSYMNLILFVLLGINLLGSLFNILTTFNFTTIFNLLVDLVLFIYFSNAFFYQYTKKLKKLENMNNKIVFYLLCSILMILYLLMLLKYISLHPVIKILGYITQLVILLFFSRYIYLYKNFKEMKACSKK